MTPSFGGLHGRRWSHDRQWALLIGVLVAVDAAVIGGSLALAYSVRIGSGLLAYSAPHEPAAYLRFALASVPIWLALFALLGLYRRDTLLGGLQEYRRVLQGCTAGVLAIIVISFFWRDAMQLSRGWLLLAWGFACGLACTGRFAVRRLGYALRRRGWLTATVLIAGANEQGCAIADQWLHNPTSGMRVAGFVDDFKPIGTPVIDGLQVLGRPSTLDQIAHRTGCQEVVVVTGAVAWETFEEIIARATQPNGFTVRLSPGFYEMLATGVAVTNKSFVPLFTVDEARLVGVDRALKLALDYGLAVPLTLLALPAMAVFAAGLRLACPAGPVLARYPTAGQGGRVFAMLKFHTRVPPAASGLERLLARSGLDKLPQLFNVLAGQMSLVGPRPRVIREAAGDARSIHTLRSVKPGMLGRWAAPPSPGSPDESQDELYYVRNWTVWLDVQILAQTAAALLGSAFHPVSRLGLGRERPGAQARDL